MFLGGHEVVGESECTSLKRVQSIFHSVLVHVKRYKGTFQNAERYLSAGSESTLVRRVKGLVYF